MSWMDVALIAIGAFVLLSVLSLVVFLLLARSSRRWFDRESARMDEEHEEFRQRHGFGPRR